MKKSSLKPPDDDKAKITPANGFYLCLPLKPADLIVPVKVTLPEMVEKIKALSMSQVVAIWKPADPALLKEKKANETEIPNYTIGDIIIHREQGQNTFRPYASAKDLIFVHHTMVMGKITGLDVKKTGPKSKGIYQ